MQQSYLLKRGQRMKHLVRRWYLLISDMLCTATHPFAQVCKRIGRVVHAAIERSSKNGAMNGVTGVLFTFEDGSQKMLFGNRSECHSWVMAVHVNSKAEATQLNKLFEVRAENVRSHNRAVFKSPRILILFGYTRTPFSGSEYPKTG